MLISRSELDNLREQVRRIAKAENFPLNELLASSVDVIVFGSRASGLQRVDSDLDLLAVGPMNVHKKKGRIDVICVSEPEAQSLVWQHSEIFRHVQAYGISLLHNSPLISSVVDGHAANRKRHRLETLFLKLMGSWEALNDDYKVKYFIKLRREFQRYRLLAQGLPVPPTAILDAEVESQEAREDILDQLIDFCGRNPDESETARGLLNRDAQRLRPLLSK